MIKSKNNQTAKEMMRRSLEELKGDIIQWTPLLLEQEKSEQDKEEKEPAGDPWFLPQDPFLLMQRIILHHQESIKERVKALRWEDRNREFRARDWLEKRGFITKAGKVVKLTFFQPTEKGFEWAEKKGLTVPRFKSGWLHEAILRRTVQAWRVLEPQIRIKSGTPVSDVQPDKLVILPEGTVVAIQVSVTTPSAREADRALRLAEHVGWVLLVGLSKGKASKLKKALVDEESRRGDRARELFHKIVVGDALSVMDGDFSFECAAG